MSPTHEMYLKVLYEVRGKHDIARVRDLATGLGVSPGAVSGVLKKLERSGFVEHERYGVVLLTEAGVAVAECIVRRHETIRDVLVEMFGVEPETAAEDACLMEHAVSPATVNHMIRALRRHRAMRSPGPDRSDERWDCSACEAAGECQALAAALH